jgi:hypothetical protein
VVILRCILLGVFWEEVVAYGMRGNHATYMLEAMKYGMLRDMDRDDR